MKFKHTVLSLSILSAFLSPTVFAAGAQATDGDLTLYESSYSSDGTTLSSTAGHILSIENKNISVSAGLRGVQAWNPNSTVNVGTQETDSLEINASGSSSALYGVIGSDNSFVTLKGKNIQITAEDRSQAQIATAFYAQNGASLSAGSNATETIHIKAYGAEEVGGNPSAAVMAIAQSGKPGAKVDLNAKNILIESSGWGVHVQSGTQDETAPEGSSSVTLTADEIRIDSEAIGISAFSNGQMNVRGNLIVNAKNAIDTRGNATININTDGEHSTVLNGDIVFETPNAPGDTQNSGNIINSKVNINLSSAESSWTGRAYQTYRVQSAEGSYSDIENVELNADPYHGNVTDFSLVMRNGAQWNMTGDSFVNDIEVADGASINMQSDAEVFNVDGLALENAAVNMQGGENQKATINRLSARNASLNMRASTKDGKSIQTGQFEVLKSVEEGSDLGVTLTGITSDDIQDAQAAMDSVKNTVVAKGATIEKTIVEGDVRGAITETTAADGSRSVAKTAENTKLLSMKGVNAAALVAWRDEVAYTNQRMEFLRDNTHAYGAWAQVYGGESAYDDASVDLTTTTVQVGADATIGDWVAGAAFSYMSGDADMSNGQADTDAYTLSLYASRMFHSGLFVNGLARYGRLSTDATAGNMDGSYDNNAFSVGGNVGYRFTFAEQAFVEPMFGLQYAYVTGDDYRASNGVKVEQDDFDALIASLGVRTGFDFAKDAGKLYARASVNHDFLGEVDGKASKGDLAESMYVDLGGTWFTYGVGTQFNITDNLSVWGNVDRTMGGEVSTRYMMNAGLRYVF